MVRRALGIRHPRTAVKAQALTDYLAVMVDNEDFQEPRLALDIDGASSSKGYRVRGILEKEGEIIVELSIMFDFPISNN